MNRIQIVLVALGLVFACEAQLQAQIPNDSCENAIPIEVGDVVPFENFGAEDELLTTTTTCFQVSIFGDLWYRFEATEDGPVVFTLCGSDFDTVIAIYSDFLTCPPSLFEDEIACDDNTCDVLNAQVSISAVAGQVYYVRVGGGVYEGPEYGTGVLTVSSSTSGAPTFRRGDVNQDGGFDISDSVALLAELFIPGSVVSDCEDAKDLNDDESVDISDVVFGLAALFIPGSTAIPSPGSASCGDDPVGDTLDCASFGGCP